MSTGARFGWKGLLTNRRRGSSAQTVTQPSRRPLGRKSRAILVYLLTYAGHRVRRETLIELLWAEHRDAHGRGSLRQCLVEIRHSVPDLVSSERGELWIEETAGEAFGGSPRAGLFEDLDHLTPEFDEWMSDQRAKQAALEWLELTSRVEDMLNHARARETLPLIDRMRRIDPYNENWVRLAMRAEHSAGHPAGIVQVFGGFTDCLKRDLGVGPTMKTQALRDALLEELTSESPRRAGSAPASAASVERLLGMG